MKPLEWALVQSDWRPYKKKKYEYTKETSGRCALRAKPR